MKKLLLFSNSTNYGSDFLQHAINPIKEFLEENNVKKIVFIPYAIVSLTYDDYENKVKRKFKEIGFDITSIHNFEDKIEVINKSECIVVGGGNTFQLLNLIYETGIYNVIKEKVNNGCPYIGWSAGSNIACPTISTTNDMPIVFPKTFQAFGFINFQINPHFTEKTIENHAGETREQRIKEFLSLNPSIKVLGLREGCWLKILDNRIFHFGNATSKLFLSKNQFIEITNGEVTHFFV